jgi:ribosomal protein S18 acetylase RimI-like enzyme
VNRTGEFEPVGARPAHRRKGLGKAVILEGLPRLRERGAEAGIVYSVHSNEAATKLYESAGFRTLLHPVFGPGED